MGVGLLREPGECGEHSEGFEEEDAVVRMWGRGVESEGHRRDPDPKPG